MRKVLCLSFLFPMVAAAAPAPEDAIRFMERLDNGMLQGFELLQDNPGLSQLSAHSKHMKQLVQDGKVFGGSIFEEPYGYCFGAGVNAQAWWAAQLSAARAQQVEAHHEEGVKSAYARYQDYRASCVETAEQIAQHGVPEFERIDTEGEPPREGCLGIAGVKQDGTVGFVAYNCPKA